MTVSVFVKSFYKITHCPRNFKNRAYTKDNKQKNKLHYELGTCDNKQCPQLKIFKKVVDKIQLRPNSKLTHLSPVYTSRNFLYVTFFICHIKTFFLVVF